MADISRRITRKSLKAKRKAAIKTIKLQAKEKIRLVKMECSIDAQRKKAREIEREQKKELKVQKANARISYNERHPRPYTLGEDLFNSICHGIGAGLGVAAIVLLLLKSIYNAPAALHNAWVISFAVLGASYFIFYLMSTLAHAITASGGRRFFSIMNYCALYVLLAATFTPFALCALNGNTLSACIAGLWSGCGVLLVLYTVFGRKLRGFFEFTFAAIEVSMTLFFADFGILLFAGTALHILGGLFFILRNHKWTHCIFHLFLLGGSIFQFFAIYNLI